MKRVAALPVLNPGCSDFAGAIGECSAAKQDWKNIMLVVIPVTQRGFVHPYVTCQRKKIDVRGALWYGIAEPRCQYKRQKMLFYTHWLL